VIEILELILTSHVHFVATDVLVTFIVETIHSVFVFLEGFIVFLLTVGFIVFLFVLIAVFFVFILGSMLFLMDSSHLFDKLNISWVHRFVSFSKGDCKLLNLFKIVRVNDMNRDRFVIPSKNDLSIFFKLNCL
jgi:hypothetical protein